MQAVSTGAEAGRGEEEREEPSHGRGPTRLGTEPRRADSDPERPVVVGVQHGHALVGQALVERDDVADQDRERQVDCAQVAACEVVGPNPDPRRLAHRMTMTGRGRG
jgi:hypothetical protein